MNKYALVCRHYQINRSVGDVVTVDAQFILPLDPRDSESISRALATLEILLGSSAGINLVRGADRPRCSWCGSLAEMKDAVKCGSCGGNL